MIWTDAEHLTNLLELLRRPGHELELVAFDELAAYLPVHGTVWGDSGEIIQRHAWEARGTVWVSMCPPGTSKTACCHYRIDAAAGRYRLVRDYTDHYDRCPLLRGAP